MRLCTSDVSYILVKFTLLLVCSTDAVVDEYLYNIVKIMSQLYLYLFHMAFDILIIVFEDLTQYIIMVVLFQ